MKPRARAVLFALGLAASLAVAARVYKGSPSAWPAVPWALSIVPFLLSVRSGGPARRVRASSAALLAFAAVLPVLVRVANLDGDRMHTDEFLTGYFSLHHDFVKTSFFAPVPEWYEWQGQFPSPFFLLQKIFLSIFGASTLTLRLSIQMYVALVSVMLFLIARELLDTASAIAAVVLSAFLAGSVYLETLGFMFISSTAAFLVFFYFALKTYRTGEVSWAALAGVACGFCYLTYYSSYLALPMLFAFVGFDFLRRRKAFVLQNLAVSLAGVVLVVAPFVAYGMRSGNYVWHRTNQVSLLTGEWSRFRDLIASGERTVLSVVAENMMLSLQSFRRDGIGGHGGYDFGRLAFFDAFSLALFLLGVLAGLVLAWRRSEILFVFLAIAVFFLTGMVLTIPPPAFHRFSIAFPFLAFVMALPFFALLKARRVPAAVRGAAAAGLLLVFAAVNQRHFVEFVIHDQPGDELLLSELLNQRFPGRSLYVAAFDNFSFEKIFYFRDRHPGTRRIETTFHANLLAKFNRGERYVYVIILADSFHNDFRKADPKGHWTRFSNAYSLFFN